MALCRVQYGKYFPSCSYFATYLCIIAEYEKQGKYLPILHEKICDNYFIVKCLLKSNESKTASTNFIWSYFVFRNSFLFHISIRIFCILFICLVFDGLLQLIYFRMFCSKHSITFQNMYLLSS